MRTQWTCWHRNFGKHYTLREIYSTSEEENKNQKFYHHKSNRSVINSRGSKKKPWCPKSLGLLAIPISILHMRLHTKFQSPKWTGEGCSKISISIRAFILRKKRKKQNGYILLVLIRNEKIRPLCFLQLLKLEKIKCLYFLASG